MKQNIKAIVTDIEGTTTSLSFVQETLLPYAQSRMSDFVFDNEYELKELLDGVRIEERNPDLTVQEVLEVLNRYIDEEVHSAPLVTLQSRIWESGYELGELVGHIYDDALAGLKRWNDKGIRVYAYSSCAVQAQKVLFAHTHVGDITEVFSGYFDGTHGEKDEPESYRGIADTLKLNPTEILFLSDSIEEADAASKAGLNTMVLDREKSLFDAHGHVVAHSFESILSSVSINA